MPERFKSGLYHARRYTSAQLFNGFYPSLLVRLRCQWLIPALERMFIHSRVSVISSCECNSACANFSAWINFYPPCSSCSVFCSCFCFTVELVDDVRCRKAQIVYSVNVKYRTWHVLYLAAAAWRSISDYLCLRMWQLINTSVINTAADGFRDCRSSPLR